MLSETCFKNPVRASPLRVSQSVLTLLLTPPMEEGFSFLCCEDPAVDL